MMFNDLAIVVHTCDKYEFCWEGWWETFNRNWDFNLGIDIYFANEEKNINFPKVKQLKTGVGEFSDRLNRAFNMIPHKHVIYWQEDMWMLEMIDNLEHHYNDFIKYDMDNLMLMFNLHRKYFKKSFFKFHDEILDDKYIKSDIENTPLVISHLPTIWKKEFFQKYLQNSEDPWLNEIEGTRRAKEDNKIKEINNYSILDLNYWFTPVCNRGRLADFAEEVKIGIFMKSFETKDIREVIYHKPPKKP